MTRPISRRQLFAGKFIIIVLFFALIPSLMLVAGRASGLLPPHSATFSEFTTLPPIFARFLIYSLCFMLIASLTHNTPQFVFSMLVVSIAVFSMLLLAARDFDHAGRILQNHTALNWTLKTVLIAGLTAIIYNQYTRRKPLVTISATALLALLLLAIWHLWPTIPKP